jgi:thiol-disulfide isomerase/thioredoxin
MPASFFFIFFSKFRLLGGFLIIGLTSLSQSHSGILKGEIKNHHSKWEAKIYILGINDIASSFSGSDLFVIDSFLVNKQDKFSYDLSRLPDTTHLFRLNFSRRGIVSKGGIRQGKKDENFIFFYPSNESRITIKANSDSIYAYHVSSNSLHNKEILQLRKISNEPIYYAEDIQKRLLKITKSEVTKDSAMNIIFNEYKAILEKNNKQIRKFIVKTKSGLAAVLAMQTLLQNSDKQKELDFLETASKKWILNKISGKYSKQILYQINEFKYSLPIGSIAPEISLHDTSRQNVVSLHGQKNKLTIVDFWASWCKPCREQIKTILKPLYKEMHDKGLQIFSVSLDSDLNSWKKAIRTDQSSWIHVSDLIGEKSELYKIYKIPSLPTMYLLDYNFKILKKDILGADLIQFVKNYLSLQ